MYMSIVNKKEDISTNEHVDVKKTTYGIVSQVKFKRQNRRAYKVLKELRHGSRILKSFAELFQVRRL